MTSHDSGQGEGVQLVEIRVADAPDAWAAAGFAVHDDTLTIGATTIRLTGPGPEGALGIRSWAVAGLRLDGDDLDGLPTLVVDRPANGPLPPTDIDADERGRGPSAPSTDTGTTPATVHPNGCVGLDHVVVQTPALDRTIAAAERAGLPCRRIRDTTSYGAPMRQAFFRLGPTVLEVVSGDSGAGRAVSDAPSTWFGLAVDVVDLDVTRALLGEHLGSIRTAVQSGRRIATFRHRNLGMSVALAAMDHHADR